jgi:hypothetical protein
MKTEKEILERLVFILNAVETGGDPMISNQGQGMDGYTALAEFCAIAKEARKLL